MCLWSDGTLGPFGGGLEVYSGFIRAFLSEQLPVTKDVDQ